MMPSRTFTRPLPFLLLGLHLAVTPAANAADPAPHPWMDTKLPADRRADLLVAQMTIAEKETLIFSSFGSLFAEKSYVPPAAAIMGSAGYTPGIARLGIPAGYETDAGLGVATQRDSSEPYRERTSLPSGIATAASWNVALAAKGGAMIGKEARDSGFNILLAGGVNLMREPRNGRNFEYAGEDPLLAGSIVGAEIAGVQSNNIVSTIKHFAANDQETGRMAVSANIAEDQARASDLLAFEFAIERGNPGSVMCAYNRYDSVYACENDFLLNSVLKGDWGYKGWVMSDWGAVHSTVAAINAGLDQESGSTFDDTPFFSPAAIDKALADGKITPQRLDDMTHRILRSLFATGVIDHPVKTAPIDYAADGAVSQADEEEAIVLLKNESAQLPLARNVKKIAVIGGHADKGVLAGGGSSTVFAVGGNPVPGLGPKTFPGPIIYHPSSPLAAIKTRLPDATIRYDEGTDPKAAAKLAAASDIVLLFATQWAAEDLDVPLTLHDNQDALIAAVAAANPHVVVVIESGGPVLMPWVAKVPAIVEAWFPGTSGGEAIARMLFGEIDASGRLPATFPAALDQLPRPALLGGDKKRREFFDVTYSEGAAIGYKWFDRTKQTPLFAFGHGLSYTEFAYRDLKATLENGTLTLGFTVENIGARDGKAVPQLYIGPKAGGWEAPRRLAGFSKLSLAAHASGSGSVTVDPRLLATYDTKEKAWKIAAGTYRVELGSSAASIAKTIEVTLPAQTIPAKHPQ